LLFLGVTRAEKTNQKPKYASIESVFGGKDRVEKESMGRCFINGKTFISYEPSWKGLLGVVVWT
jgi:hypothetical protein